MRNYYIVLEMLKGFLEADPLVNTVTNVDEEVFDMDKKNIYPIVDILCESAAISLQNEPTPEPRVYQNQNLLDGWQMTLEIETSNTEIAVC